MTNFAIYVFGTVPPSPHPKHLHNLIPQVIDYLHRNPARLRAREGSRRGAVQGGPGVLVDFGLEGGLERLVGVAGAEEVGVADEEALLVVVGVDEPAGDAVDSPLWSGSSTPFFKGMCHQFT